MKNASFLFDGAGLESLEDRRLMAGDVSATVTGGDLRIDGDNEGNEVVVRASDNLNEFVVEGLNGTTINGQASMVFQGVTDDLRINLRGGDNRLLLTAEGLNADHGTLRIADDLDIRAGSGDNVLVLDHVVVQGNVRMRTGNGEDVMIGVRSQFLGTVQANAGGGEDLVGFDSCVMGDEVRVNLGSGNDMYTSFGSIFSDRVRVSAGSGDDVMGESGSTYQDDLRLDGNSGFDRHLQDGLTVNGDTDRSSIEFIATVDEQEISDEVQNFAGLFVGVELLLEEGTGF